MILISLCSGEIFKRFFEIFELSDNLFVLGKGRLTHKRFATQKAEFLSENQKLCAECGVL